MARTRNAYLLGAAVIALVGTAAARAQAAPGIARGALDQPTLNQLPRLGVIVVGAPALETTAARTFVAASLVAAGHQVVVLPIAPSTPSRQWLLGQCASHDLDAVTLVRISTDAPGWRVNVDIHDPEGAPIPLPSTPHTDDPYSGGNSSLVPVFASFWFSMSGADVDACAQAAATTDDQEEVAHEPHDERPRLWVSERFAMFGPVRIRDEEFFRLVGRPDLYKRHTAAIATTRAIGYTALGAGLTTLVLVAAASGFESGVCEGPNLVSAAASRPQTCGGSTTSLFAIPLALSALGGSLLIAAAALSSDRPSLETRKTLAREYNARLNDGGAPSSASARPPPRVRIAVSATPSLNGDGGVMLINGRF